MDAKYVQCAAKCCGNKLLDRPDLTFFTFPENDNLAKIWACNSNLSYYYYGSTLCAEHFEDKYLDNKCGRKIFKANIEPIPTIFGSEDQKDRQIPARLYDSLLSNVNSPLEFGNFGSYTDHFMETNVCTSNVNTKKCVVNSNHNLAEFDFCRLCANLFQTNTLKSIFGASNYSELLEMCLPGKFLEIDDLSHKICVTCVSKLENCCTILKSFIEADKKLRNITKPSTSHQTDFISNPSDEIIDVLNIPEKEIIQFQCIMCPSVFNNKDEIIIHAFHSHPTSRGNKIISNIIKTKVAGYDGKDSNQIKRKTTKRFQCIICMDILNTKEDVITHTKSKHKVLSYDKILTKIVDVDQQKTTLNVKYMCISCPTIYDSKEEVIKHALLRHCQNKIVSKSVVIKRNDTVKGNEVIANESNTQKVNEPKKLFTYSKFQNKINRAPINISTIKRNWRRSKKVTAEYTETYKIKYRCRDCSILFNSYKNVLDHAELLHPTLKESGLVASLVKVRNSVANNDEKNSDNKENNLVTDDQIICVNDDTIIEVDPNIKPEQRKMITENRYKCLKCFKLCTNKKMMLQHSLSAHPTDLTPDSEITCKLVKVKRKFNTGQRFECLICSSHHVTKNGLLYHTRIIHPSISKDKFLCRFVTQANIQSKECLHCDAVIKNYNYYRNHMNTHVTFTCEECGLKFKQFNYLKAHLDTHETSKPVIETYKCITCETTFTDKIQLQIHEQIHKVLIDVTCSKCNKPFTSEYELKRHERNVHAICLCDVCGKTYEIKYIRHHLQTHNTNHPYKCKLCTKSFKTCGSLSKHKKYHFPSPNKHVTCQICGKLCLRESINLHIKVHSSEMPWGCEICGENFRRKDYLQNHKKTHMQDTKIYACKFCNTDLFSRRSYSNHLATVHGSKSELFITKSNKCFTCGICKKEFKYRINMEDHLRMHAGQRIYSCNVCGKAFGTKIVLLQHKKTHLEYDELPYQCDICKKKFSRSENLRNHRRVHTGEKPFPCPICYRPFRVRGEMVKHMRIHKRNDERKKISPVVISETDSSDNSTDNLYSVHDSNSFEGIVGINMPSLD